MQYRGQSNKAARGRGRWSTTPQPTELRQVPTALGPKIHSLAYEDIRTETHYGRVEITDCRYIASYNLMSGLTKTIFVPGRPPLWTPSSDNMKLMADSGHYYRDENAARFQEQPLEPAVRSIFHMNPGFDPTVIDIFACGSTLGNLLRFVQGKGECFSFIVYILGQTAFFVRRDLSPTELIDGIRGFGHNFVDANTTWSHDVKGSSSHQRIIAYLLGGHKLLVRFEADGYTMDQTDDLDSDDDTGGIPVSTNSVEDHLADILNPQVLARATNDVTVLRRGSPTVQSSTIDIKTRSIRKQRNDVMAEQLPRLWLRQIDKIVLSFHENGVFGPAAVQDIRSKILEWEDENQAVIAEFSVLIKRIKEAAKLADGGKLEVRCSGAAYLHFHELIPPKQSRWEVVPDKLRQFWVPD